MENIKIALVQFHETSPLRLIRRNLRILDPVAASVLVKVHTGVDCFVDSIRAEPRSWPGGWRSLREASESREHNQKQKETGHAHCENSPLRNG